MQARLALVLTALLATAALAGPATAGEPLTKRAFRQRANEVCRAANLEIGQVFDEAIDELPGPGEFPPELREAVKERALPLFRESLDRVEDLDGPASFVKKVAKMVDGYRAVADDIDDDPRLAISEEDIWRGPDRMAKRLGLRRCVQG